MSLLDVLETQKYLDQIALERGQYCYEWVKKLQRQNELLLKVLYAAREFWVYHAGPLAGNVASVQLDLEQAFAEYSTGSLRGRGVVDAIY